jgi:prolipoprotein diacylglyceryltransferase
MRISNQTLKWLIAIAGIVIIFLTFQIMTGGIVWLEWGFLLGSIFITWLFSKVPPRRKRPLVGLYLIIFSAFPFAFIFLRSLHALKLFLLTLAILLITFIAASIVAIFYPERRHPR